MRIGLIGAGNLMTNLGKALAACEENEIVQVWSRTEKSARALASILNTSCATDIDNVREADVYILSSHLETFGVAPIEALACGVPLIATDCGGPRSYMNDFNGLLIPVNDVKAMAEAIAYMKEHYMEYDRKRIAEDCKQRFSTEAISKQLEKIFEDVIAKSKKE